MQKVTRGLVVVKATCNGSNEVVEREFHTGMKTDCEVIVNKYSERLRSSVPSF
jgi:hypothetical protein